MDCVRKISIKLLEHNWRFFHQMELSNASSNATAVTVNKNKETTGRTKEGTKEGLSTGLSVEESQKYTTN